MPKLHVEDLELGDVADIWSRCKTVILVADIILELMPKLHIEDSELGNVADICILELRDLLTPERFFHQWESSWS
jgi:hypothetical protein